jgi:hypothetical protein
VAEKEYHCSFCGGPASEIGRLVAGPGVTICKACVALCQQILATSHDHGDGAPLYAIDYPPSDHAERDRDLRLVSYHLQGDGDAFSIIIDQHSTELLNEAKRRLGSSGDPEEAVHETFMRAVQAIRRFDRYGQWQLGPWLGAILRQLWTEQRIA